MENKKLIDEILWWAKFLVAHGVNPKFVCESGEVMAQYEEREDD